LSSRRTRTSAISKIRDDQSYWERVDVYIEEHTEVEFSHGFCPDCFKKMYPGFALQGNGSAAEGSEEPQEPAEPQRKGESQGKGESGNRPAKA
jgi:hypothetical protein